MKRRYVLCVILGFMGARGGPAFAEGPELQPWVALNGGFGTYQMGHVNDDIALGNSILQSAETGLYLDEVTNGFAFGVEAGADIGRQFSVALGYERLLAGTSDEAAIGTAEYSVPGDTFRVTGRWFNPSKYQLRMGVGLGLGFVSASNTAAVRIEGESNPELSVEASGTGALVEAFLHADSPLGSGPLGWTAAAGYRYARVNELKSNGVVVEAGEGVNYTLDYSGFMARLGLRYVFGS